MPRKNSHTGSVGWTSPGHAHNSRCHKTNQNEEKSGQLRTRKQAQTGSQKRTQNNENKKLGPQGYH